MKTIFFADDHASFVDCFVLAMPPDMYQVVGVANNGPDAVREICKLKPNVAILNSHMPGMNGLDAAVEVLRNCPSTKVIIYFESEVTEFLVEGFRQGVHGFVDKRDSLQELHDAIRRVANGEKYVSGKLLGPLWESYSRRENEDDSLTERERQVLRLVTEGHSTKEIGGLLNLSAKTVDSHRTKLMRKLNVHDTASLVRCAIRRGLVEA